MTYDTEITTYADWYSVSVEQVKKYGGYGLLRQHRGSLLGALKAVYPQITWNEYRFSRPHNVLNGTSMFSKAQRSLFQQLQHVFPSFQMLFNYKFLVNDGHTRAIEFDVSTPSFFNILIKK